MEDFSDYGYLQLDKKRYLKPLVSCMRNGRKCPICTVLGRSCERYECTQQHFPILFRVDGHMLTGAEYQAYLVHGTVPCLTQ